MDSRESSRDPVARERLTHEDRPPALFLAAVFSAILRDAGYRLVSTFITQGLRDEVLLYSRTKYPRTLVTQDTAQCVWVTNAVTVVGTSHDFVDLETGFSYRLVPCIGLPDTAANPYPGVDFGLNWQNTRWGNPSTHPATGWYYRAPITGRYRLRMTWEGVINNADTVAYAVQPVVVRNRGPVRNPSFTAYRSFTTIGGGVLGGDILGAGGILPLPPGNTATVLLLDVLLDLEVGDLITTHFVVINSLAYGEVVSISNMELVVDCLSAPPKLRWAEYAPEMTQADFVAWVMAKFNLFATIDLEKRTVEIEPYDDFLLEPGTAVDLSARGLREFELINPLLRRREIYRHTVIEDDAGATLNIAPELEQYENTSYLPSVDSPADIGSQPGATYITLRDSPVWFAQLTSLVNTAGFAAPVFTVLGAPPTPAGQRVLVPLVLSRALYDTPANAPFPETPSDAIGLRTLSVVDRYVGTNGLEFNVRWFDPLATNPYAIKKSDTLFEFRDWVSLSSIKYIATVLHEGRRMNARLGHQAIARIVTTPADEVWLNGRYLLKIGNMFYRLIAFEGFTPTGPAEVELTLELAYVYNA